MATKRTPPAPRAIPPHHATWAQREAAAEIAGVEYVADLDGVAPNMHWVIRHRTPGKKVGEWEIFEHCKTVAKSEVEHRVAILNRGKPTRAENQSWGKLTKQRARTGKGVKSSDPNEVSATEWVERLYADPQTSRVLWDYAACNLALKLETLRSLLSDVDEAGRDFTDELLRAISIQLWRKFGITPAEEGRWQEHYNRS